MRHDVQKAIPSRPPIFEHLLAILLHSDAFRRTKEVEARVSPNASEESFATKWVFLVET